MNNLEQIIAEARRSLVCPICGRSYEASEIRLRGFLDNAYIIQTICSNGHMPLLKEKVTVNDVIDSHARLENFDGNINRLWESA